MAILVDLGDGFQEDDQGTRIELTIVDQAGEAVPIGGINLTDSLKLRKHAADTKLRTTTLVSDGSDGKMQYITVAGDLVPFGQWQLQAHVVDSNGDHHSVTKDFEVRCNL
ncbi:MAG: hypothetical protein V3R83_09750 [Gammaproteobacteria bacterium]